MDGNEVLRTTLTRSGRCGFVSNGEKQRAMETDALSATHPIQQPVKTESEADSAFDEITYLKGQVVPAHARELSRRRGFPQRASAVTCRRTNFPTPRPPTSGMRSATCRKSTSAQSPRAGLSSQAFRSFRLTPRSPASE